MNQPEDVPERLLRIRFSVGGKRHEVRIPLPVAPVSCLVDQGAAPGLPEGKSHGLHLVTDLAQVTEPGRSRMAQSVVSTATPATLNVAAAHEAVPENAGMIGGAPQHPPAIDKGADRDGRVNAQELGLKGG